MSHWLIEALQTGLESIEHSELVRRACQHAMVEGEWSPGKVRPSLIAEECRLARVKKYRGHDPAPGVKGNGAMKGGAPDAATAIHFYRGYVAEGMAVAALCQVSRSYQVWETGDQLTYAGLGMYPFDVLGASPWLLFEHEGYQAHPDLLIATDQGIELVQMKCPSVWAFQRYERDGGQAIRKRYEPQAIAEMYIGRLMGLPIVANHVLVFALEGPLPSSDVAKSGQKVLAQVETVLWDDNAERFVESIAAEILEDDQRASQGQYPPAYPVGTRWPCDYCLYSRDMCEENKQWEQPHVTILTPVSPASLPTGRSAIPSPTPTSPSFPTSTPPGASSGRKSPPPLLSPVRLLPPQ